jgi:hypothetical protein
LALFDFFRKLTSGNYGLIARNITYNYYILINNYENDFEDRKELIYLAGFLNAFEYTTRGQLTAYDIANAFELAIGGYCGIMPYVKKHSDFMNSRQERELLLNFIMQMEVLYFRIDTKVGLNHIVDTVISQKRKIEMNIEDRFIDFKYSRNLNLKLEYEIAIFMSNYLENKKNENEGMHLEWDLEKGGPKE